MDAIGDLSVLSPGILDELDLEAYMGSVGDSCYPQQIEPRRNGGHQLPESPPDSGSENPYSPPDPQPHVITVPQTALTSEYRLVNHIPTHEMLQQNGEYVYEELKADNVENLNDVVVLSQDAIVDLGMRQVRHDLIDPMYQGRYGMRVDMPQLDQMGPQLVALEQETIPVFPVQESSGKKRKLDNSQVKCEPAALSPESTSHVARAPPSVDGSEAGDDTPQQCIRFSPFQQTAWHMLYDGNLKPLQTPSYVVGADKGFNFSQIDEAFVCQKKNHFQVTCQIQVQGDPQYAKTTDGFKKLNSFCLHFYGVKAEDPSQEVRVEQSQSDRTKKPFHPVPVEIRREGAKVTVGRLHFAETTNNNMRKKGRPNPDQRHFQLVVALKAHTPNAEYMVVAHASDRIIVRASNPGQFESDCTESWWQRGVSDNSVHFNGRVGINTDRPDEACVVNGNLKVMGHILHPSDARAKHDIVELDTAQQLRNVQSMRVVMYSYDAPFAAHSGLLGYDPRGAAPARDTGVLAQELRSVLPDAVKEAGDVTLPNGNTIPKFLVVNKDRIFMENLGAVKELCKVTGNLESRIDQLEKINKKLCKISVLQRRDSSRSSGSNDSRYSAMSNSSKSLYNDQIRDIARSIRKHEYCHKMNHNSPKYTRKQCKNCHGNDTKYGKYNYNKTCERFYTKKAENLENPNYIGGKVPEENFSTLSKKKDTCLWLRSDDDFSYGHTKLRFCCRKDYGDASGELISNKFLQIVITILIFIMAVCLVVMSVLYFKEHQQLITMKESRLHDTFPNYSGYGKIHSKSDPNHIQISKSLPQTKKSVKEKGQHKTTQEFTTTAPTEALHTVATTLHQIRNYVNSINMVQSTAPQVDKSINISKTADIIGGRCAYAANYNNKLESDCQTSCGLDPPQTYENQEPLEGSKLDKDPKEASIRPLEPQHSEKSPIAPPEKNNSESLHYNNIGDREFITENNSLDSNKQNISEVRQKREATEEIRSSSEDMTLNDQSREVGNGRDCDTVHFGITSKSIETNASIFSERVCAQTIYNINYTVPLSHCLNHKNMEITFRSLKLKEFRLCDVYCSYVDSSKICQHNSELPKLTPNGNQWGVKMGLECNEEKNLMIRARFTPVKTDYIVSKDLCYSALEILTTYVEFNIRIYSEC